jgi:arsenite methyltransferase
MGDHTIQVYDPPLCCPTGVCGPSVDPELLRIAADLKWLEGEGVAVERFNLAQQADAFVKNPAVLDLLNAHDTECLPVVVFDGEVVAQGGYPTREQLVSWLGLTAVE